MLTIAGSDPSGGAGIQADLKSLQYTGVHGLSVITCVTSQNTREVKNIFPVPLSIIEAQLDAVFEDCEITAVKTGMLYDGQIVSLVAKKTAEHDLHPVVDPVMKSSHDDSLSTKSFIDALKTTLIPQSLVVTANIDEASALMNKKITSIGDMEAACSVLYAIGGKYIVVKGGHLKGDAAIDVVYDGKKISRLISPRYEGLCVHGSGCNFAALIAGFIGGGKSPLSAIKLAKQHLWNLFATRYSPGSGLSVIDYSCELNINTSFSMRHLETALKLLSATKKIIKILPPFVIPEVGSNICYALPNAKSIKNICGLNGRILATSSGVYKCGTMQYGVSKHVATVVLSAMYHDPKYRAAMNIAYSQATIESCKQAGLKIGSFSREKEPETAPSSMEWGAHQVITQVGVIPDIIFDKGGQGKEAMIRILGISPDDLIKKVQIIIKQGINQI